MLNDPTPKTPRTKKPTPETPDAQGNRNTWEQNKNEDHPMCFRHELEMGYDPLAPKQFARFQ